MQGLTGGQIAPFPGFPEVLGDILDDGSVLELGDPKKEGFVGDRLFFGNMKEEVEMIIQQGIGQNLDPGKDFDLPHQVMKMLLFEVLEDKPPVDDPRETMIKSSTFRRNSWQAHVTPPC